MKPFRWDTKKNNQLQSERGISFETVSRVISAGKVLDVVEHPNQIKYPKQRIFVLEINQYVYLVPFVENEEEVFLKTIIPSRKMKKKYLGD
jgi:uncharacterized DUF497 family protein